MLTFYEAEIPVLSKEGKGSNGGRRNGLGFKERISLLRISLKTWKLTIFKMRQCPTPAEEKDLSGDLSIVGKDRPE